MAFHKKNMLAIPQAILAGMCGIHAIGAVAVAIQGGYIKVEPS
jgi:hypothetical protein